MLCNWVQRAVRAAGTLGSALRSLRPREDNRALSSTSERQEDINMLTNVSRSRIIQVWFVAVALVVAGAVALGVSMTVSTAVMLLALSVVPAGLVFLLWPAVQPLSAGDVLRGSDPRA
jgi:hypothetical protein